jgi:hypothetical protein
LKSSGRKACLQLKLLEDFPQGASVQAALVGAAGIRDVIAFWESQPCLSFRRPGKLSVIA